MPAINGTYHQVAFRVFNDDGAEATHTPVANQDTNVTLILDKSYQFRFLMDETDPLGDNVQGMQFECNKNGGAFQNVTGASTIVRAFTSSHLTDLEDTTSQLTGGAGTFLADNDGRTTDGLTPYKGPWTSKKWEVEGCLQGRSADLSAGDTSVIRIQQMGASFTYDTTLTVTWAAPVSAVHQSQVMLGVGPQ